MSMRGDESTDELIAQERECLSRFREKARELQAANPALSSKFAFGKAVEQLSPDIKPLSVDAGRCWNCAACAALPLG